MSERVQETDRMEGGKETNNIREKAGERREVELVHCAEFTHPETGVETLPIE